MMKPILLFVSFLLTLSSYAQSLDYVSVRKKNGRVAKNFYAGSTILLETKDGAYWTGPISSIKNDSLFISVYDVRFFPTTFGSYIKDTVSVTTVGLKTIDIKRIQLTDKGSFFERRGGQLLMLGGAAYFALNVLNGAFFNHSITKARNLRILGISAGAFGIGFFINKIFSNDGFTKSSHRIVYVDL